MLLLIYFGFFVYSIAIGSFASLLIWLFSEAVKKGKVFVVVWLVCVIVSYVILRIIDSTGMLIIK
jgi:hypothetical protein